MPKAARSAIAVHGGAGLQANSLSKKEQLIFTVSIKRSVIAGMKCLYAGGSASDAVEESVRILEDNPLFNAGRGAVFNSAGFHELDAAIMDGSGAAGAVAGLRTVKNPISFVRKIMDHNPHIFFSTEAAEKLAKELKCESAPPEYFFVKARWNEFERAKKTNTVSLDHEGFDKKFGTVGAVACDQKGNLAAATSTGGLTNKLEGRIGDTPVLGAGTYASPLVAVSCTGRGEEFMRRVTAYRIHALMELNDYSLSKAVKKVVKELPPNCGGIIAVDSKARVSIEFNTPGMFRGSINAKGELMLGVY